MELWVIFVSSVVTLLIVEGIVTYRYAKLHETQGHEFKFDKILQEAKDIRFKVEELETNLKGDDK